MKMFVAFVVFLVIGLCDGQTNPMAWSRDQRTRTDARATNQEVSNEVPINTERLLSAIETRILVLVRSETGILKQQLSRLEQSNNRVESAIDSLKTDVTGLKDILDDIREKSPVQDLSNEDQSFTNRDISQKLDSLGLLINTVRGTVSKLERDVITVKNNVRTNNARQTQNQQPQFALVPSRNEAQSYHDVCTASDPNSNSGLRKIRPNFYAYCEIDEEDANGWIVIQKRYDGTTDFFRSWNEYKQGFGNIAGEFWMGLDKIYELTSSKLHELMIEMEDFNDTKKVAKYSAFGISDESSFYALSILGSFSGDAEDSLNYHAGMKFSTFDNDNDGWADGNCARSHFGGWWYNSCDESNLNGRYFENGKVETANKYQGIYWSTFTGSLSSLKSVKMMIRPVDI